MFCDELFDISENGVQTDELHAFAEHMMCHQFVLDYTSAILSIVLSHQFQKDDIKKMLAILCRKTGESNMKGSRYLSLSKKRLFRMKSNVPF